MLEEVYVHYRSLLLDILILFLFVCRVNATTLSHGAGLHSMESVGDNEKELKAVVVSDSLMGNMKLANWLQSCLTQDGYQVNRASLSQIADSTWWKTIGRSLLVLPDGSRMPAKAGDLTKEYLQSGGHILAFGTPLFDDQTLFKVDDKWVTKAEIDRERGLVKPERQIIKISPDEAGYWSHGLIDTVSVEEAHDSEIHFGEGGQIGLPRTFHALHFSLLPKGESYLSRTFNESPFTSPNDLMIFNAKGDSTTKWLYVQWQERDGSQWFVQVQLTTHWKRYVISPRDYQYWEPSPTAVVHGYKGDSFDPLEALSLMLGSELPKTRWDPHAFWVAEVAKASEPNIEEADYTSPDLDALSPAYKFYPLQGSYNFKVAYPFNTKVGKVDFPATVGSANVKIMSPLGRPSNNGLSENGRRYRIIPLLKDDKKWGNLAWAEVNTEGLLKGSWWVAFGDADETYWLSHAHALSELLQESLHWLNRGILLEEGGPDRYTAYEGDSIHVGARITNVGGLTGVVPLTVIVKKAGDLKEVIRHESRINIDTGKVENAIWMVPHLREGRYEVSVAIGDPVFDELRQELVVTKKPALSKSDLVTVKDGHFVYQNKRWFALGVNYWPKTVIGEVTTGLNQVWLDPSAYDPVSVESDLVLLQKLGFNCVSISYTQVSQALSLMDFLRRCKNHDIKVNLAVAGAHPFAYDPNLLKQLLNTADLKDQAALFAYDIAWEPRWGVYYQRRKYSDEWLKWVMEKYGNIQNAEQSWGYKMPLDSLGKPTVPSDDQVDKNGPWRVMTVAYRQFLNDFTDQRYETITSYLRKLDPNHLLGNRTGYAGGPFDSQVPMPYDFTTGAKYLDFISPEGYFLSYQSEGSKNDFAHAEFATAYARWAGKGKPVLWAEFGLTLHFGDFSFQWYSDSVRLHDQAKILGRFFNLAYNSDADGSIPWWFPAGYRPTEQSDFGIVNPDGSPRAAAKMAQEWSSRLHSMTMNRERHKEVAILYIDPQIDARGAEGLWMRYGNEFTHLISEGKWVELRSR